jgi:hypothetical protein
MADLLTKYGTGGQDLSITLESLASGSAREGASVSNATDLFVDVLISACMLLGSGSPAGDKAVYVYAYGSVDGSVYTDGATGADAAITPTSPTNLRLVGVISAPTASTAYYGGPWSLAAAFGGSVPQTWGIVILNSTGVALSASSETSYVKYQGVSLQTV